MDNLIEGLSSESFGRTACETKLSLRDIVGVPKANRPSRRMIGGEIEYFCRPLLIVKRGGT